ncbi:DNA-binding protein [Acidisoma silvae]|uniref:DNA-binding protein n=1 Tax=Acidisoma silvae TaxID=2802396 RepID=A0A963YV39_9PROT|nr:DNA-binding protein [Acidisoma silvae]MCB8877603.1 DNA-binding protein [Acidisoma silvae]
MHIVENIEMEKTVVIPANPDARLTRDEAAKFLTDLGFQTKPATLATIATRGGGPTFQHFGKRPLYRREDLLAWAHSKLSAPKHNTSCN